MADELSADASADNIKLIGDVLEQITEWRDDAAETDD